MVLTALPLVSISSYAEDEVVYEVHTWEELDAFDLFYADKMFNGLI